MSRPIAWRPLACLPILKGGACTNIDTEWQRLRRVGLDHKVMAPIIADVNDICSTERYYRFADKVVRCGRAFWHLLSMDGAEIAAATLCGSVTVAQTTAQLVSVPKRNWTKLARLTRSGRPAR